MSRTEEIEAAPTPVVLNVDDDAAGRYAKSRILKQAGFEVREAATGASALEEVTSHRPALVLLDVRLPDMDGFEVCARIKARWPEVLVLQTSAAFVLGEDRVRGLESGADSYLSQPVTPNELVAVVRAMLRLRVAEQALAQSEARYRLLTEALPQLVWSADANGDCDYVSSQFLAYTGLPEAALLGTGVYAVLHPDDGPRLIEHVQGAREGRHPFDLDVRLRRHDGVYRWFKARAAAQLDRNGEPERWFGVLTDIQDIVEARETLDRSREDLERQVEARTADLSAANAQLIAEVAERERTQEALRHAQKMEAIGQLTGGVAHDFNNLLTAISGNLELLQRRLSAGRTDVGRLVDGAVASARRAATLTERLLAFSRRQSLTPKGVDLNRLVDGLGELIRRTVGEQIRLRIEAAEGLWPAWCDPSQMENAILNLAINARDAMPDGGVLTISTANVEIGGDDEDRELAPGAYARVSVADTGAGMTAEVAERAFDPFFTTKPIGQGTGLGLSQVYGFVKQSGGQAKITSEPGLGATVRILLPRYAGPAPEAETRAAAPTACGQGQIVLVVEDEALVREFVVQTLAEAGYCVLEAGDPRAALAILETAQPIDLMITDVGLPGLNGRQLADSVRLNLRRANLKVLFMTGYAHQAAFNGEALEPGTDLIAKPFQIDQLRARVETMLAG